MTLLRRWLVLLFALVLGLVPLGEALANPAAWVARNAARQAGRARFAGRLAALEGAGAAPGSLLARAAQRNVGLSQAQVRRKALQQAALQASNPIRQAGLPNRGRVRFVPPKDWSPNQPLPTGTLYGRTGYVDRYGRVWHRGPNHHFPRNGQRHEWDVQVPRDSQWASLARDGRHIDVEFQPPGGLLGQ